MALGDFQWAELQSSPQFSKAFAHISPIWNIKIETIFTITLLWYFYFMVLQSRGQGEDSVGITCYAGLITWVWILRIQVEAGHNIGNVWCPRLLYQEMGDRRQKNQHRLPVDTGGQSEAHSRKTVRDSVSNQVKVRADSSDFPLTSTCVPHIYISCTQAKRGKVTHALYTHTSRGNWQDHPLRRCHGPFNAPVTRASWVVSREDGINQGRVHLTGIEPLDQMGSIQTSLDSPEETATLSTIHSTSEAAAAFGLCLPPGVAG